MVMEFGEVITLINRSPYIIQLKLNFTRRSFLCKPNCNITNRVKCRIFVLHEPIRHICFYIRLSVLSVTYQLNYSYQIIIKNLKNWFADKFPHIFHNNRELHFKRPCIWMKPKLRWTISCISPYTIRKLC